MRVPLLYDQLDIEAMRRLTAILEGGTRDTDRQFSLRNLYEYVSRIAATSPLGRPDHIGE